MRTCLAALAILLTATVAPAADTVAPDPALSPADVIETQLAALQSNDEPESDAGIAQTWAFAHPDNKRITGPLERFAQMIKGPLYKILIDHSSRMIQEVSRTPDEAVFVVTVTGESGEVMVYQWRVAKVADGDHAGAWMTTSVSIPALPGQAI